MLLDANCVRSRPSLRSVIYLKGGSRLDVSYARNSQLMLRSVASPEGNAQLDVRCAKYKMCWVKVSFCLGAVLLGKSCVRLTKSLA